MSFLKDVFKRNNIIDEEDIKLSKSQYEAVTTKAPNCLVIAGAGSGKTRVITERVKYLLKNGAEPSGIVVITYTNLAAEEIKIRLSDVRGISDVFIGTIHSFANKVMRNSSNQSYTLLTSEIYNMFFRELITKYAKFLTFERFLKYMDLRKNADLGIISEIEANSFLSVSEQCEFCIFEGKTVPNTYEWKDEEYPETVKTLMVKNNTITFNQLLKKATGYFKSINSEMEHLLVDEFQDVGSLEYNFFVSLKSKNNFFVGDDYQSIYGFKGGNVNIIIKLSKDPTFKVIMLKNNYRNAKCILDVAQNVINQVHNKIEKQIVPLNNDDGEVYIDNKKMLKPILELIKDEDKDKLNEWFILVRTNKELYQVQNLLDDLRIPNHTFKREGLSLASLNNILKYNSIKLLTVHTSKGLENKNVILYGNFPLKQPKYRRNEEERKVMYVGITRAKENLIILN